jgi:TonB-dependent starch-binding outer membrane protein SusC
MKKLHIFLFVLFAQFICAQATEIKGKISDEETGEGLPGVSILVKGTTTGTSTDIDGNFTLSVPDKNSSLIVTMFGYNLQELEIGDQTDFNIQLSPDTKTLDEVVVVGYATVNRRDLTGSVSSVSARQIKDTPLTNAAEAITGRLAGVRVTTSEGAPGADIQIRIRGGGSITQDNSPIYIVDGIQVENALNFISPQDIESIDVLKDASTTAIYGARGANGVVIITTKSGKGGKTTVTYNGSVGTREIFKKMNVLDPYDFVQWQYERSRGDIPAETSFASQYGTFADIEKFRSTPKIDWQEEVFGRQAGYQNHNFNINGGTLNTNYNLSLTSNTEDGVLLESGFDRKLVTFRLDHKISDKFKTGFNVRYNDQTVHGAGTTNSGTKATNRLRHSVQYRPMIVADQDIDFFDEALYLSGGGQALSNPIAMTQAEYRKAFTKDLNISGFLNFNIFKNLVWRSTVGINNNNIRNDQFWSKITGTARNFASLPVASIGQIAGNTINNSNTLQYFQKYNKHDVSLLVGHEVYEMNLKSSTMETRYFPAEITPEKALANMGLGSAPAGAAQPRAATNVNPPNRLLSFFGRANYSFNDKYLATFSLRSDRSSKFKYENGALLFPSGTVAWKFTKEGFFQNIKWLNEGKLRYGYGAAGNNRIGDLLYLQLYGVTGEYAINHNVVPGYAPIALSNENLKWESNISQNIGLDLGILNNKVQLTFDAYANKGQDLLLAVAIPGTTGYASQIRNLGSTSNKGLEMQVTAYPIDRKNFSWTTNFNISTNKNEVLSLGSVTQQTRNSGWQGSDGTDDYLLKVGEPVGLMYGFTTDGFYKVEEFNFDATTNTYRLKDGIAANLVYGTPQPGMLKWKDIDGDGQITADKDRSVIGNANPKFIGGWNNQFAYKNIDMSVFVNFVSGNDIYNANKIEMTDGAFPNLNMLDVMKNRWTNINESGQVVTDPTALAALNANATIWSPVRVQRYWLHSWAVEDGSFLRLNNLTLGYTLPQSISKKAKISKLRLYTTVNNLATFTSYSGYDPEVNTRRGDPLTQGVDFAGYPRAKTYVGGVNLTF